MVKRKLFGGSNVETGDLDFRYLTLRQGKKKTRRYWSRPGHKLVRLIDTPGWAAQITNLNQLADARDKKGVVIDGTVKWAINKYRATERYKELSKSTSAIYNRWLGEIESTFGDLHCRDITRRVVGEWVDANDTSVSTKRHMAATMSNVMKQAIKANFIQSNPAEDLEIGAQAPRDSVWTADQRWTWLRAARRHRHNWTMRVYFHLLYFTAQRRIDALGMTWDQYSEELVTIREELPDGTIATRQVVEGLIEAVTQEKTRKVVDIPVHKHMRWVLAAVRRRWPENEFMVPGAKGRPFYENTMTKMFSEVSSNAGLGDDDLLGRDLRRTAMVVLGRLGMPEAAIASLSGHSIEGTRRILETYMPRDTTMARNAIRHWERAGGNAVIRKTGRKKSNGSKIRAV